MGAKFRTCFNWLLAGGYAFISVFLVIVAFNEAFYGPLTPEGVRLSVLRHAPCGAVSRYSRYVLEDRNGWLRGPREKLDFLVLLLAAEKRGIRLCYDGRLALPYLGGEAERRYSMDENEPFNPITENLVFKRRDPVLLKAAFDRYRTIEPRVASRLCWLLETNHPDEPAYAALRQTYCPPPRPPAAEPALTPEERRRKEAFDRILEDSRNGLL